MTASNSKSSSLLIKGIIDVIHEKKQDSLLPEVTTALRAISEKKQKDKTAVVWSTYLLAKTDISRLKKIISKYTNTDCNIVNKIDSSLLGGFRINLGDWVLDASLKSEINNIEKALS